MSRFDEKVVGMTFNAVDGVRSRGDSVLERKQRAAVGHTGVSPSIYVKLRERKEGKSEIYKVKHTPVYNPDE